MKTKKDSGTIRDWRKKRSYDSKMQCGILEQTLERKRTLVGKLVQSKWCVVKDIVPVLIS